MSPVSLLLPQGQTFKTVFNQIFYNILLCEFIVSLWQIYVE